MRQREATKRYMGELFGSLAIYAVILVAAIRLGRPMEPGVWRVVVLTTPMIGFGLMLWALVRHFRRMDEYIRRLALENTAITAGITAGLTFTYGFLETAGYPRLSMFTVWMIMGASWAAVAGIRSLAGR